MDVRFYEDDMQVAWDEYVRARPEGTVFHLTSWKRVIERAFGFKARYLAAEENGTIQGILPLFLTSNWVQGRALISTPFAVYGGVCASDAAARRELRAAACQIAIKEGVQYLELRERVEDGVDGPNGFLTKQLYVTFDCALDNDPDRLLRGFPKDTRYMIRKAQKSGLRLATDNHQLDSFYEIYAHSLRNLGTPVFARRFFKILLEEFGADAEISVVWRGGDAVAAVLSLRHRDWLVPYYGGTLTHARSLGASNFMYWEIIRNACRLGLRYFDFGRSKLGTGSHFFKTQWNMRERPLPYQYYLVRRKDLPNFSPVNPRFKMATALWKRLPFPLTKAFGPRLVRLFP